MCWVRAVWHRSLGRLAYALSLSKPARRHFERVLQLHGDDFVAYVYLGRLAYDDGDTAGWRRECLHARRLAPARYARLSARASQRGLYPLFEPDDPTAFPTRGLEGASERATWRVFEAESLGHTPSAIATANAIAWTGGAWGDDFSSESERAAFCQLPPIGPDDVAAVDLDKLTDQLGCWDEH